MSKRLKGIISDKQVSQLASPVLQGGVTAPRRNL
jgi:hypothetical protein